jgi:hypothetical protein
MRLISLSDAANLFKRSDENIRLHIKKNKIQPKAVLIKSRVHPGSTSKFRETEINLYDYHVLKTDLRF